MDQFKPDFVLVSAGFDAYQGDILGELNYTNHGYKEAAKNLNNIAKDYSNGHIIYMLEGGYTPENIKNATASIIDVLINN